MNLMQPHSYRNDDKVLPFNDRKGLVVFDHECVFCSGFVRFVFANDPDGKFNFAAAQSPLGQSLYRHYGLPETDFTTNLVIADGRLYTKMDAFAAVMSQLRWPLKGLAVLKLVPSWLSTPIYDCIARNRYRIWGRYDTCMIPSDELRRRVVGEE